VYCAKIYHETKVIGSCWGNLREREKLGRPRRRWEGNIEKYLQKVGWGMDRIDAA